MFSEKTVANILGLTKKTLLKEEPNVFHDEDSVMEAVNTLYQLMALPDDEIDFGASYAKIFEEHYFESLEDMKIVSKLFNLEGMMKKILRLKNMDDWTAGPPLKQGETQKHEWMLGDLFRYFHIRARFGNRNVSFASNDPGSFADLNNLCEHFVRAYQARNNAAHDMDAGDLRELDEKRFSVLLVYLDMCARHKALIKAKYAAVQVEKVFDREKYLKKVIAAYKEQEKKYLTVYWRKMSGGDAVDKKKITTLVETDTEAKVIKLIGAAGVGKSESMKYVQYQQCQQCMGSSGNKQLLPIRVELIDLKESLSLGAVIARELDVMEENIESIFTAASVTLYLDGYNEILDTDVRIQASKDIDNMIKQYPKVKFVIADRSVNTNPRCAEKATCYELEPLDGTQILEFFKKNAVRPDNETQDKAILQQILNNYEEKFNWLENGKTTPLMLLAVLDMLREGAEIPGDPTEFMFKYLEMLFRREDATKHDARIEVLKECLTDLVEDVLPDETSTATLRTVRKSFMKSGAGDMDKAVLLVKLAIDMGILEGKEETEEIGWAKPEYYVYFYERFE